MTGILLCIAAALAASFFTTKERIRVSRLAMCSECIERHAAAGATLRCEVASPGVFPLVRAIGGTIRFKSNCLFFAGWLWVTTGFRGWLSVKRSSAMKGAVPHFSMIHERGDELYIFEYSPRKSKRSLFSRGDFFLWFDGKCRVRVYRKIDACEGLTLSQASDMVRCVGGRRASR